MADRNTITTEFGDIEIPAWASEATMSRVAAYASAEAKTNAKFAKIMEKAGGNLKDLQKEIAGLATSVNVDQTKDEAEAKKQLGFSKAVTNVSKDIDSAMKFFEKTDKPFTAIVDGVSGLTKSAMKAGSGLNFISKLSDKFPAMMPALGAATNVAVDAALAYAGWNAAKLEQFAEAQAKIIDSGVVFNEGSAAFDLLRKRTIDAGVTYSALIDNIHAHGEGMLGLGSTMSAGVDNFTKFYASLDDSVESLGDLGLASKDMQAQYAEYLSFARRTGIINSDLNQSADDVNSSFINLQIEAGAVANLTALTRQEAMRRQIQAYDEFGEAAVMTMRDMGLPNQADVADQIIKGLGLIAPDSEYMQTILNAFQQEAFEKATTGADNFDITARLQNMMPGLEAALNRVMPGFIEGLEDMMNAGDINQGDAMDYIFDALSKADMERDASYNATAGTVAGLQQQIQANTVLLNRKFGNLAEPDALETEVENQKDNLKAAGKVTKEMNEMKRRFLQMQETLTMDMETTAGMFDWMTNMFENGTSTLLTMAGLEQSINDFGGIGGDSSAHMTAFSGGVIETPAFTGYTANIDDDESAELTANKELHNSLLNREITALDFEGFNQIHNIDNTIAQLNSLSPVMRERMMNALTQFEEQYAGTDTKITVSRGNITAGPNDELNWQNVGMGASLMIMQGSDMVSTDQDGVYSSSKFQDILSANQLTTSATTGAGTVAPTEANQFTLNEFIMGNETQGMLSTPTNRRFGGPVQANRPYFVGDQMGLDTAEIFIPGQSGTIVNNDQVINAINQMSGSRLTDQQNTSIINSTTDLSELLRSKQQVIGSVKALQAIVKRLNNNKNFDIDVDMMNSR